MSALKSILEERGARYGDFGDLALVAQDLKTTLRKKYGAHELAAYQVEALDLIATKLARIVVGDPNHADSWADLSGYAQLVVNRLEGKS